MRINELLVESQLDEGPITRAIGKGVGKVAKGVVGLGKDLKTGFKAGYSGQTPPAPSGNTTAPQAKKPGVMAKLGQAVSDFSAGMNATNGTAAPAADPVAAQAPAQPTPQAAPSPVAQKAGETLYAQVKANVSKLDKKGKQRILALLQKSLEAPAVATKAAPVATPADAPKKKRAVAPSQAEIDADRNRIMGVTSDSVIRTGKVMAEGFSLYKK